MSFIKGLVSVITPLYNGELYVESTIISVLEQTYSNWELIISDDCSTDSSVRIVEKYLAKDKRIKLIQNEVNSGPAVSRNRAIELARGEFIAFLDSDDIWFKNKLFVQINFMKRNNFHFTFSYYNQITEEGNFVKSLDSFPEKINYIALLKSNKIGCLTAVYDVSFFGKVFMYNIAKRQDFVLWLRLLKRVEYAYCVKEILASYRIRENSVSSNKLSLIKYHWFIYRHIEKFSFFKSLYITTIYVCGKMF